jgi:hypothetical protein
MIGEISTYRSFDHIQYALPFFMSLIYPQPLYASAAYSAKFTLFFAAYTASVVHAGLFHHRQIWSGIKSLFNRRHRQEHQNDIHNRLMQVYDEAPHWWYAIVFAAAFIMAAAALAKWLPEAPLWVSQRARLEC